MQVLIVPDPKLLRLDYGKGRGGVCTAGSHGS